MVSLLTVFLESLCCLLVIHLNVSYLHKFEHFCKFIYNNIYYREFFIITVLAIFVKRAVLFNCRKMINTYILVNFVKFMLPTQDGKDNLRMVPFVSLHATNVYMLTKGTILVVGSKWMR